MSNIIEEIGFEGSGLNWDDDRRYFRIKGDSEYKLNILVGEDGSNGIITNSLGNHVITYELGDSSVYFVLGSCYDTLNRCVYYWVFSLPYDTTGSGDYLYDNRLLRFNEDTETIDTIFIDDHNYFGLDPDYPMKDPFILGDWLYFNPRVSEPKMIDVVRALNYTKAVLGLDDHSVYDATLTYSYGDKVIYYGGLFRANQAIGVGDTPVTDTAKWDRIGDAYQDYVSLNNDSEFRYAFNVIKQPSTIRPKCVYDYDADKEVNNIKNTLFRFSYRYKYFDNSYSVYSSYSDITLPDSAEEYNGEIPDDVITNNFIKVNLALPSAALVKEVELVFQEVGGEWKRAKIINRQDIELIDVFNYVYNFYNDESYPSVLNIEVAKIYDAVPRTAECQEIINKNILNYGYCLEGFDNIDKNDIDVSLTPEMQDLAIPKGVSVVKRDNINQNDIELEHVELGVVAMKRYTGLWISTFDIGSWYAGAGIVAGDKYRVQINEVDYFYTILAADVLSVDAFTTAIGTFLSTNYPQYTHVTDLVNHKVQVKMFTSLTSWKPPYFSVSKFYSETAVEDLVLYKKRGFKTGAWHPFCLFYYDGSLRRWDAQTSKDNPDGVNIFEIDGTTVYVPMFNEISPSPGTTAHKWVINWEIFHQPPVGAKYWRWGYAGNSLCSFFIQYIIQDIESTVSDPVNSVRINITPLQTIKTTIEATWNQYPQSIIDPYEWIKGDRVRFITEASNGAVFGDYMGSLVDGVYDFEIIKFDGDNNYIYVQDFDFVAAGIDQDSLIEIYRPLQNNTSTIFYEFSELYPVLEDANGDLVHGGDMQDQVWDTNTPATGVFDAGDVYHIMRCPDKPLFFPVNTSKCYFHESQWYSDFYESDDWDRGKVGVETNFNARYLNIIRYSRPYLQNTQINGLPTFDTDATDWPGYKELNDVYGKILRIIEIGDTLKVYQRKKPSSILIGRTEYTDAEGHSVQISSAQILGGIRYSNTNYGTEFPASISRNNRYVYGFDIYNGVFWRDSANGIFPISGRYEATDGTGDYKMDSYFKQKAKALLVSGIDHVDVMTVWDERYKLLYITFKDYVDEDNDDTIVFHEPSNRWICFTEFDQTPAEGWNQILELSYDIVRGFEGGIGYSFNEDDRFAYFNIETTTNVTRDIDLLEIEVEPLAPTITSSPYMLAGLLDVEIEPKDPVVHISQVSLSVTDMQWEWDEGNSAWKIASVMTSTEDTAIITAIPSWITVLNGSGFPVSVNDPIGDGETIQIYPKNNNTSPTDRVGTVDFEDDIGNTASIDVTQLGYTSAPTVSVEHFVDDTSGLTISSASGTALDSSNIVNITFTPDHPSHSIYEHYTLYWLAKVNTSYAGEGSFTVTEEISNNKNITISIVVHNGDTVTVYLSGIPTDV